MTSFKQSAPTLGSDAVYASRSTNLGWALATLAGGWVLLMMASAFWTVEAFSDEVTGSVRCILAGASTLLGAVLSALGTWLGRKNHLMRRRLEQLAIDFRAHLSAISRSTGMMEMDMDGTIIWANEKWLRIFGLEPGELIGSHHSVLIDSSASKNKAYRRFWNRLRRGDYLAGEYKHRGRDGNVVWLQATYNPVLGRDGHPYKVIAFAHSITMRKQTEAELRDSRERAQSALREIDALRYALDQHSLLSTTDRFGNIIDVNSGFCKISGYSADELIGKNFRILNSGEHAESFWAGVWNTISVGKAWRGEVCNRRKDGSLYWVDTTIVPYLNADGTVEKYVSIRFDITAQKNQQRALADAQALLKQTGKAAKIGGWSVDLEKMEPVWSEEVFRIHDVPLGEQPPLEEAIEFYPEEARHLIKNAFHKAVDEGAKFDLELPLITRKGRKIWVRAIGIPERRDNRTVKLWGALQDVTSKKESEERLKSLARRLETATDGAGIGVWEFVPTNLEFLWDAATYKMFGMAEGSGTESIERWKGLIHPEDRCETERRLRESTRSGEPFDVEFRVVVADKVRHIQARGVVESGIVSGDPRIFGVHLDVTEQRQAELALKLSEDRFERAVAGSTDGLWDYTVETGHVWYSDRFRDLLKIPASDDRAFPPHLDSWLERIYPEEKQEVQQAIQTHLTQQRPFDVSFRMRTDEGHYRWFRARGQASRGDDGSAPRMAGSITDIHEKRSAEDRLNLAIKAANAGLWDWHIDTGEAVFNSNFHTMLGYEPGELAASVDTWSVLIHPDDRALVRREIKRSLSGESSTYRSERRMRCSDGSWRWILDIGEVVEWSLDGGTPLRMSGVQIDIQNLKEITHRLELTLKSANAGLWDWNIPEAFILCNSVYFKMIGDKPEDRRVPCDYFFSRLHPDDQCRAERAIEAAFDRDEAGYDVEFRLRCEDGTYKWIRSTGRVIERAPNGTPLRMIGQHLDVDAQTRARHDVEQLNEELAEQIAFANSMAANAEAANLAKSEFLANMSHEIRTPMTAILGYTDLLADEFRSDNDRREQMHQVTTIRENAEFLLSIVNDILDMSKIESGKLSIERLRFDPAKVVREVITLMKHRAQGKGIKLEVCFDGVLPETIHSDPTRLRQILLNLIGNAVKFTEFGTVKVQVSLSDSGPESQLRFAVIDEGIGMTSEHRARIAQFEAFNQADSSTTRKFGGSGLGLRISSCLATMLGGRIEIESTYGQGSTFTAFVATGALDNVVMRSAEAVAQEHLTKTKVAALAPVTDSPEKPLEAKRILLAEDGPDNQRLFSLILRKAGATVAIAEDGKKAMELALNPPDGKGFDVVLMDMQMPVMDGYAATEQLRQCGYVGPIIALTAHAMAEHRSKCIEAGCNSFAAKPIDRPKLIEAISAAIGHSSVRSGVSRDSDCERSGLKSIASTVNESS